MTAADVLETLARWAGQTPVFYLVAVLVAGVAIVGVWLISEGH